MLPRILSTILLISSFIIAEKLVHDSTILNFWTTPWTIGVLSTLALASSGVGLLFLGNKSEAYIVLFIFSGIYTISSVVLYICWAYQHVLHISNAEDYFGFLSLFVVTTAVSAICIFVSKKEEMFILPSWCFGFANAGVILLIVYKYVFVQKSWFFWPFAGELIIVILGAVVFIYSYLIATDL